MSKRKNDDTDQEMDDPREALRNFVVESKVAAFVASYAPAPSEALADRCFTSNELRKYFDAYVKTVGDPLAVYVDDYLCRVHHFKFVTSALLGEPVLPVTFVAPDSP